MTDFSRRQLLAAGTAAALFARAAEARPPTVPAVKAAAAAIKAGKRPVEAAVKGVTEVENDPDDHSVGLGGLPNEEGVVELDACVMDGTRGLGGAVASLRNIQNPAQVALKVLNRTDHVMLVGHGAYRFARAHGFPHIELLTDAARKKWLHWKEHLSNRDDWVPRRDGGTITCLVRNPAGELGGSTTTSGLPWKIPGRIGDSPILGAGLYVDDTGGAAGCTGRGEACILACASYLAVETMRRGATPKEAALEACRRIVARTKDTRLLSPNGRPTFNVVVYALGRDGSHGAASIHSGKSYAVHDAKGARIIPAAYLFER